MNFIFPFTFSLLLLTNGIFAQQIESDERGFIIEIGDKVPDIKFNLTNGDSTSINDLKGKVIVLQFTASWCSVCRKEMPHLEKEVWQKFKDDNFILIGVDFDEPLEKVIEFEKKMNISYPMALDPDAEIFQLFAVKRGGVTRNIVIDQEGKIAFLTRLFEEEEFNAMIDKIAELLNQ
jgi:peroxiredoxin